MSRRKETASGAMLDLWRPPADAGDAVGCLATTYTFAPGLFDEQCLARFLEIDSEPNREDFVFLLEREHRLGGVYAGVLVDHTQAGVEHFYRWDVLPVRIPMGKQHAKISLLAWDRCLRVIVSSANLTEQGYRFNQEVAGHLDLTPDSADHASFADALQFLRRLLRFVPGPSDQLPTVARAEAFLADAERRVRTWTAGSSRSTPRQHLVFTLPADGPGRSAQSSLDEAIAYCRARGGAPSTTWIASPFFDGDDGAAELTTRLCKAMARGVKRRLSLAVPVSRDEGSGALRILAPKTLLTTPEHYNAVIDVEALPDKDTDKNLRPWHAKMVGFRHGDYSALMIGSSNFTGAGMGVGGRRNAEANLLTIVQREAFARAEGQLDAIWPEMTAIDDPENVEWQGADPEQDEDEQETGTPLHPAFLAAVYHAGENRRIVLWLKPEDLPRSWTLRITGLDAQEILNTRTWKRDGALPVVEIAWAPAQPPGTLVVGWEGHEAFMPVNVDDRSALPPPAQVGAMSADDILGILAAADPSAAFRAWAKRQGRAEAEDDELDSAVPVDLDPLRRYDLQATFLHRVRRRARVLAQLRANLERPVPSRQALEWRLRGMLGVEVLAGRFYQEVVNANPADVGEALLTMADFLIVLGEVDYQTPQHGSLPKDAFDEVFRGFLRELVSEIRKKTATERERIPEDLWSFWERVVVKGRG